MGRPKGTGKYTLKLDEEICKRISLGETLASICKDIGIERSTVYRWFEAHQDFSQRFAHAREIGFDAIADEALNIADTPVIGDIEETGENDKGPFHKLKRADMIEHRKLQVETRLKLLSKWCPKKYGNNAALEVTGADGGAIKTETKATISALSNEELIAIASMKVDDEE